MATIEELKKQINVLIEQIASLQGSIKKADHIFDNISKENNDKEISVLLDSSCLIALICKDDDAHHISVKSTMEAIRPYGVSFYVPFLVFMESMSRLVKSKKWSVQKAKKKLLEVLSKILEAKCEPSFNYNKVYSSYDIYSRKAIKALTAIDFYLVVTGIGLSAKILTCDFEMYSKTKKSYGNIYFITDQSLKKESDLPKLIKEIVAKRQVKKV